MNATQTTVRFWPPRRRDGNKRAPRRSGATRQTPAAFTLIELLIVMLVIVVLAALTLRLYDSAQERARYNRCKTELWQIEAACEQYRRDNGNRYPPGDGINSVPQSLLLLVNGPKNYLDWPRDRIVPTGLLDPWGGVYGYKVFIAQPDVYGLLNKDTSKPLIQNSRGDIANRQVVGGGSRGNRS